MKTYDDVSASREERERKLLEVMRTVFVILYALLQIGMFVYGIYTWFADDDD